MTIQTPLLGNAPGLPKSAVENTNAALWAIVDLCLAGRLILKNAPDGFLDTSEGVSLRAILDAISGTADDAMLEGGKRA